MEGSHAPSVGPTDVVRIVIDEQSFDFRNLSEQQIEDHLDHFNAALRNLLAQDLQVACPPMWDAANCLDDCELVSFLSRDYPSKVDRDTLLLCHRLLDRCPEWPEREVPGLDAEVVVSGEGTILAFSISYALEMAVKRRAVACLVFPGSSRRGFRAVRGVADSSAPIYFFSESDRLPEFWRTMFLVENVPESRFFALAPYAFPDLIFVPRLSFRAFDGSYLGLRERVVAVLAALNDHFAVELRLCKGIPHDVQAAMGRRSVDVSPESSKTRGSDKLMRRRDVLYEDQTVRCEWHAKLERHRNRIHFSLPMDSFDGRILVGIFTRHLDT